MGGFSNDPQRPLTGTGGPFVFVNNLPVYNTDRQNAIYDFGSGLVLKDEVEYNMRVENDPEVSDEMPVYRPKGLTTPIVYFDSRTYQFNRQNDTFFNHYENIGPTSQDPSAQSPFGTARPYLSNLTSTVTGANKYQNDKTFQIVCAGPDNKFGGSGWNSPAIFIFPTGGSVPAGSNRYNASIDPAQLDNITNFSEATLEDGLEN